MKSNHTTVNRRDRRKVHVIVDEIREAEHALLDTEHALLEAENQKEYYVKAWKTAKTQHATAEYNVMRLNKIAKIYGWLFWIVFVQYVVALGYMWSFKN